MMIIKLPDVWIVISDVLAWLGVHMTIAYIATIIPEKMIKVNFFLFRKGKWEKEGTFYDKIFRIKVWKELLPDGSSLFRKGFRKKRLRSKDPDYISRFILETCRAEAAHWLVIVFSPVFFLWNYEWAGFVMIAYAIVANLPCILAQRYNRIRMTRIAGDAINYKKNC